MFFIASFWKFHIKVSSEENSALDFVVHFFIICAFIQRTIHVNRSTQRSFFSHDMSGARHASCKAELVGVSFKIIFASGAVEKICQNSKT